ncbi:MAG: LysM peptidoglycan-binding domain-containing protein [Ilumatobacteraceae bacterium]
MLMSPAAPLHVVAEPGDTLWSIAEEHHGTSGFRSYLDTLIQLNGGTAIQAGQAVRLP